MNQTKTVPLFYKRKTTDQKKRMASMYSGTIWELWKNLSYTTEKSKTNDKQYKRRFQCRENSSIWLKCTGYMSCRKWCGFLYCIETESENCF